VVPLPKWLHSRWFNHEYLDSGRLDCGRLVLTGGSTAGGSTAGWLDDRVARQAQGVRPPKWYGSRWFDH
jgi:hypothetical protein